MKNNLRSVTITFTDGVLQYYPYVTDGDHAIWIAAIGVALAIITIVTVMIIRKKKYKELSEKGG